MRPELSEYDFVKTTDSNGMENGWVTGVYGTDEGLVAYQTLVFGTMDKKTPTVKGYHGYKNQTNHLTCTGGFVTIRVFWDGVRKVDYKLAEHRPVSLTIPPGNPYAIMNYEVEFGRVVNHPEPLWNLDTFADDQYAWSPTKEQEAQNGEIVDLTEFKPKEIQ